jgi:hypothetical protein
MWPILDGSQIRTAHGPQVMAALRNLAITALRLSGATNIDAAPQVVVPQIADKPYWAARVAELGIGSAHDGPTPTFESLSAALRTALTPETRARASAVAGAIRTDGSTAAAKLLFDAFSQERPSVSA